MKTIQENRQEYIELQQQINIIITTAKLIGHKINKDNIADRYTITQQSDIFPFMTLSLHGTINTTKIETNYKGTKTILKPRVSYEIKLTHLQNLLQKL